MNFSFITLVLFPDYITMEHHIPAENTWNYERPTRSTRLDPSFFYHGRFPGRDRHYLNIFCVYSEYCKTAFRTDLINSKDLSFVVCINPYPC